MENMAETIEESYETEVRRKIVRTKLNIEEISMDTIRLLHPEALEKFIPKIGDRLAILDFCSKVQVPQFKRRGSLLEKLRSKLNKHRDNDLDKNFASTSKKDNTSKKPTRTIDIGWMHSKDGRLVQVRTKQGGGTRKVSVSRNTKPVEILEIGKKLFFVDGMSKKGHISEFSFTLCDFKCQEITEDLTVEEMFNVTHISNLRFYVTTFQKHKKLDTEVTNHCNMMIDDSTSSDSDVVENIHIAEDYKQLTHRSKKKKNIISDQIESFENVETIELVLEEDLDETSSKKTIETSSKPDSFYSLDDFDDEIESKQNKLDDEIQSTYENVSLMPDDIETTSLEAVDEAISATDDVFIIILHRGNVVDDLIRQFIPMPVHVKNSIKLEVYLPNGELENAADIGGVFRDILSESWQDFCNKYTLGTQSKVPILRHDFDEHKWTGVAKILAKGWKEEHYFPYQISKCFMEACMFKKIQSDLINDLFNYVSEMDSKILQTALQNFTNVDEDDLLDCLVNLECKWKPTEYNIKQLISDLAHKELIQKSTFIINQWYPVLKNIMDFETLDKIHEIQKNLNKSVAKALLFDENLNEAQLKVSSFLKKFIRESDHHILSSLLRFVTGSNMMIPDKQIFVKFIEITNNFCRTPTAHTCSRILNLPLSYDCYSDFRHEFRSVLTSEIWVMDIV